MAARCSLSRQLHPLHSHSFPWNPWRGGHVFNAETHHGAYQRRQGPLRGPNSEQDALRDTRGGAYDHGGASDTPTREEAQRTNRQRAQTGADVRQGVSDAELNHDSESDLPEGLTRPRVGGSTQMGTGEEARHAPLTGQTQRPSAKKGGT